MVLDVEDQEAAPAVDQWLFLFGEVPFDGEEHSGQGLAVGSHWGVVFFVNASDAEKVGQRGDGGR